MSKRRRRNGGRGFTYGKVARRRRGGVHKNQQTGHGRLSCTAPHMVELMGVLEDDAARGTYLIDPNVLERDPSLETLAAQGARFSTGVTSMRRRPIKLGVRHSEIIERLIEKYGEDKQKMMMDMKLNPFQWTVGQLKKHIVSYKFWGRRDVPSDIMMDVKKLRWYNDPLNPKKRFFVDRRRPDAKNQPISPNH